MDNKMRIVAEEFENTTTGEKVTGVTVMIDGKLRQVFDFKPVVQNSETLSRQQQKSAERSLTAWTDLICCQWGWE